MKAVFNVRPFVFLAVIGLASLISALLWHPDGITGAGVFIAVVCAGGTGCLWTVPRLLPANVTEKWLSQNPVRVMAGFLPLVVATIVAFAVVQK